MNGIGGNKGRNKSAAKLLGLAHHGQTRLNERWWSMDFGMPVDVRRMVKNTKMRQMQLPCVNGSRACHQYLSLSIIAGWRDVTMRQRENAPAML